VACACGGVRVWWRVRLVVCLCGGMCVWWYACVVCLCGGMFVWWYACVGYVDAVQVLADSGAAAADLHSFYVRLT
jgi:hypothetical protein